MKIYVQFTQPLLNLKNSHNKRLVDIYPWIKHFYRKPGTDGTKPGHYHPVCGWIHSQTMDCGTCLTGESSIVFVKIDEKYNLIGTSGHRNTFFPKQFFILEDTVNEDA